MNGKVTTAAEALAQVKDGALVAANFWGPGTPYYLWRGLKERGVKDLTLIINNYVPKTEAVRDAGAPDPSILLSQTKKLMAAFTSLRTGEVPAGDEVFARIQEGALEIESMSHGIMLERLHAGAMGLGGFYSPIGVGTLVEEGKEKRVINGVEYIFEEPIIPDVGLICAAKADTLGNLVYHGTARAYNPVIAEASRYTVAEVFEIVEPGELDPDTIVTPAAFVDKIVRIPEDDVASRQRRKEWVLVSIEYRKQRQEASKAAWEDQS